MNIFILRLILDSHAVVRINTELSCALSSAPPSGSIFIEQYHTAHRVQIQDCAGTARTLKVALSEPQLLPSHPSSSPSLSPSNH